MRDFHVFFALETTENLIDGMNLNRVLLSAPKLRITGILGIEKDNKLKAVVRAAVNPPPLLMNAGSIEKVELATVLYKG